MSPKQRGGSGERRGEGYAQNALVRAPGLPNTNTGGEEAHRFHSRLLPTTCGSPQERGFALGTPGGTQTCLQWKR